MSVSFRIKTSQGQELSFASREMFEEFVRSGDLADTDLVYDAETKGWSPARTHPIVLEIQYAQEEEEEAAAAAAEGPEEAEGEGGATDDLIAEAAAALAGPEESALTDEAPAPAETAAESEDESFGLDLAPEVEAPTVAEQTAQFVAEMEAERTQELEPEKAPDVAMSSIRMESSGSLAELFTPDEPEPQPEPEAPKRAEPQKAKIRTARPKKKNTGKKVAAFVVVLAVGAAGAYFGRDFLPTADPVDDPGNTDLVSTPIEPIEPVPDPEPEPEPTIASTEEAVGERAQERFLSSTQTLLRDLQPVPDGWLSGEYFALPSDYPEVPEVWGEYLTAVRALRGQDAERYRQAYELALDDAAVSEGRDERITRAMTQFEAVATAADEHWTRAEDLANAAIQSHTALVDAEGLILYDPSGATGRREGIGIGTSGRDSDAQLLLDQVVDLMTTSLAGEGAGPREGANVREWVWGGFLDAVTR